MQYPLTASDELEVDCGKRLDLEEVQASVHTSADAQNASIKKEDASEATTDGSQGAGEGRAGTHARDTTLAGIPGETNCETKASRNLPKKRSKAQVRKVGSDQAALRKPPLEGLNFLLSNQWGDLEHVS